MTLAAGRLFRFCLLFAAASLALMWPAGMMSGAVAQTTQAPPADGRKSVIEGIKAYESGKPEMAVATLTRAMSAGGLSSQDLAKALYYRGLANQRSKKSAQAIADLTSAVWMKGGLSPEEQKKALEVRGQAYAAVGVKDPGPPGASIGAPTVAAPAAPAPAAAKTEAKAPAVVAAPKPASGDPSTGFTTKVAKASETKIPGTEESSSSGTGDALSGVGSFFSNLFGGGSTSAPAEPAAAPQATGAINPPSAGGAPAAVSAWSSETTPSPANVKAAAPRKLANTDAATRSAPSGAYKLQVAAVRSRGEAERLAAQLRQKHAGQIGARVPDISETVFGNMGTFYQVNVGPFANSGATDKVCAALKADGFDCLVVKQ